MTQVRPFGPDVAEQTAAASTHIVAKLQSKKVAGSSAPIMAVPTGLPPEVHFEQGLIASSPLDEPPPVPLDLLFAVRQLFRPLAEVEAWREHQFQSLVAAIQEIAPLARELNDTRSVTSRRCCSHVDPALSLLVAFSMAWPDLAIAELITKGATPMGEQPPIGIYRAKFTPPTLSFSDLFRLNLEFRQQLPSRPPPQAEQAAAIWESSLKDQLDGILSDWMTIDELDQEFGYGLWLATFRFAIWQKLKYRMIDDASKGHNQTFGASETIHTTSAAAAATLARAVVDEAPHRRARPLLAGSCDMRKAYKQLGVEPSQLRYMVIAVWDPFGQPVALRDLMGPSLRPLRCSAAFQSRPRVYCRSL